MQQKKKINKLSQPFFRFSPFSLNRNRSVPETCIQSVSQIWESLTWYVGLVLGLNQIFDNDSVGLKHNAHLQKRPNISHLLLFPRLSINS